MSNKTAWLMAGYPAHKKKERRQRWMEEVVLPGGSTDKMIERAIEVFQDELEEDRRG